MNKVVRDLNQGLVFRIVLKETHLVEQEIQIYCAMVVNDGTVFLS